MIVFGRIRLRIWSCTVLALGLLTISPAREARSGESHAIAMHGTPALAAGFTHMPYANPDAPKGGRLAWGLLGTFDSLNPLIVRGLAIQQIRGFVVESLMARGNDEAFTLYGLLAKTVETDDARTYVTFHLDPQARFSDGKPVTSDDVLFSWALLRDKGRPNHRQYYAKVEELDRVSSVFVSSFCRHVDPYQMKNGLLSQWRGYAGEGEAAALAMDRVWLGEASREEPHWTDLVAVLRRALTIAKEIGNPALAGAAAPLLVRILDENIKDE